MNGPKEWTIRVGKKAEILAEFQAPMHQLDQNDLRDFLKALVVRHITHDAGEMLPYYVNKRKGSVQRASGTTDIMPYFNFEKRWSGSFCGTWDCYAMAVFNLSAEQAEAIENIQEANKGST